MHQKGASRATISHMIRTLILIESCIIGLGLLTGPDLDHGHLHQDHSTKKTSQTVTTTMNVIDASMNADPVLMREVCTGTHIITSQDDIKLILLQSGKPDCSHCMQIVCSLNYHITGQQYHPTTT